jgi:hypothetical protein
VVDVTFRDVSTATQRLKAWAGPRKWAIVGGVTPLLLALLVLGLATDDWVLVSGGMLGLALGGSLVVIFIVNPVLWEPENRWKFLGLWVAIVTLMVVAVVVLVFLLT